MPSRRAPEVCEPTDPSTGRPATFIFLHGYGDDAQGLPLGVAQQFQFNSKLPYLKWLLPNAPHNMDAMTTAWYMPKALPNSAKPRVPGQAEEEESAPDDEEGILQSVDYVDELVKGELDKGVDGRRIVIGGFSQGCAVSLVWGLLGRYRDVVGGVVAMSGYFPLAARIKELQASRPPVSSAAPSDKAAKKWLYVHGSKDMMVSSRLFTLGKEELAKYVDSEADVEEHLYEGMVHATAPAELRDLLTWLGKVVPP